MKDNIETERRKVFWYLFHGYFGMLRVENTDFESAKWLALMYACLNTSLWESGRKKLEEGGHERRGP